MRRIKIAISALMLAVAVAGAAQSTRKTAKTPTTEADSRQNVDAVKYSAALGDPAARNQLGAWYFNGKNVPKDIDKAFDLWRLASLQQFPKAISNLAVCYQYGYGTEADSITAIRLYIQSIEAGHPETYKQHSVNVGRNAFDSMLTGLCLEKGIGVDADINAAARAYAAASDLGSADGAAEASRLYATLGNAEVARPHALRAAKAGRPEGFYALGLLDGEIQSLEKAATMGYVPAANALALKVIDGAAPSVDTGRLAGIMLDNAMLGSADAMLLLAVMLKDGIGVPRDYDTAAIWLAQAIAAGNTQPKWPRQVRSRLLPSDPFCKYVSALGQLQQGNIAKARTAVSDLRKAKAPETAVIEALIQLSDDNPKGDIRKGARSLVKLTGISPLAAVTLADLYAAGRGVGIDVNQSVRLLNEAAERGYGPAIARLGDLYAEGILVPGDTDAAVDRYRRALGLRSLTDTQAATLATLTGDTDLTRRLSLYRYIDPIATINGF